MKEGGLNQLRALLREHELRATSARLSVMAVLQEHCGPLTHEAVMLALKKGRFDRASIWRVLSDLTERGILRRMDLGDHVWRFEWLDPGCAHNNDHAHFLCDSCGVVKCLPALEIRSKNGDLPNYLVDSVIRVRVAGHCGSCET